MQRERAVPLAIGLAGLLLALVLAALLLGDDAPPGPPSGPGGRPGVATGPDVDPSLTTPGATERRPSTGPGPAAGPGTGPGATTGPGTGATGATGPLAAGEPFLRGRVVDEAGRPVPGASVCAGGIPGEAVTPELVRSGDDGRFLLKDAPPTPILEVVARGFARRVLPLDGAAREVEVVLLAARRVEGRVLAAEDERPLAQATVQGESATWRGRVLTGPDGRFTLDDAPQVEELALAVSADGRVGKVVDAAGAAKVLLDRGRAVRGRVLRPDGSAAARAMVWVTAGGQLARPHVASADQDGRFEVWGVDPQDGFRVMALAARPAPGQPAAVSALDVPWFEPGEDDVVVQLAAARAVQVRGGPAGLLTLRPVDEPPWTSAVGAPTCQATGPSAAFADVAPGAYQLEHDGRPVGDPVRVPPGEGEHVLPWPGAAPAQPGQDPVMAGMQGPPAPRPRGPLRVRVEDEGRRPVEGAEVLAAGVGREAPSRTLRTGKDGVVLLDPAPQGALLLTASLAGRVLVDGAALGPDEGPAEVVLKLVRPVVLEGRIRTATGGPAELSLSTPEDKLVRTGRTQPDGSFRWPDCPPGPHVLEVTAQDCRPVTLKIDLPAPAPLTVTLEKSGEDHAHPPGEGGDHDHGH